MSPQPPARVRWASRAMALGIVVFALGLGVFLGTRFGGRESGEPSAAPSGDTAIASHAPTPSPTATPVPTPTPTPAPSLEAVIGQKLAVAMDGRSPTKALLGRIRRGEVGGIVIARANIKDPDQLAAVTTALQAAAHEGGQPPLLVMTDQEGGGIRRLPWAQPASSAARMGARDDPDDVRSIAAGAAVSLAAAGINVDLAPVADVPGDSQSFMRDTLRTFSGDPAVVARLSTAFSEGLASQGVIATAKHFPGIGRVRRNTDRYVETVRAGREDLERDLEPFRALLAAKVPLVMLSNATYTALDPDNAAGWSPAIATTLLRDELGFAGVSITDGLDGTARARKVSVASLATKAAAAGTDMLLVTGPEASSAKVYAALLDAAAAGTIDRATLDASYARVLALKSTLAADGSRAGG